MFCFFLLVCVLHVDVAQSSMEKTNTLPAADGKLHLYALPVGEGDAQVLQCPNGDIAIIDLGSWTEEGEGFWQTTEIKTFLRGHSSNLQVAQAMSLPSGRELIIIVVVVIKANSWVAVSIFLLEINTLPAADGKLHLYALPVGFGDAQVIQCPNGDIAIIDLGSWTEEGEGFWQTTEIKTFLKGHLNKIKNIFVTLDQYGHDSLFDDVFTSAADLSGLRNLYITCTAKRTHDTFKNWIKRIRASNKVRTFNGGRPCGSSNGVPCDKIKLCPKNPEIEARVLSANAGNCTDFDAGTDSIVIGVKFNNFTMLLTGDFEDIPFSESENGPQKKMVDFYGSELMVTVYKLAKQGREFSGNKRLLLDAVKPKAVFVSNNPYSKGWRYPICGITEYLSDEMKCLCKPAVTYSTSKFYCGEHPIANVSLDGKLQKKFVCGMENGDLISSRANEYAIYSTAPSECTINLIHLLTDGTKWGFVNNFYYR